MLVEFAALQPKFAAACVATSVDIQRSKSIYSQNGALSAPRRDIAPFEAPH
jgi:hypothetical protein